MGRHDHRDCKETLTSLHRKKVQEIEEAESGLESLMARLTTLESEVATMDPVSLTYRTLNAEINTLRTEVNSIKAKRINYLLKNSELLYRITEDEKTKRKAIHGISALKQRRPSEPAVAQLEYYRKFRSNIDPNYVCISENNINEENYCFECKEFKALYPDEAITICENCGQRDTVVTNTEKPSMKDPPIENKCYEYKRYTHFCDWLSNLQGKESRQVPDDVINAVIREIIREKMHNRMEDLDEADIKRYLKKYSDLRYDRYYDHATQILFRITNIQPMQMTAEMEQNLKLMFLEVQEPFELYKGKKHNFSSYAYIIYKFCQLLEYNDFLPRFKLHKNKALLYEHDVIWGKICQHKGGEEKGWKFIRS